MRFGWRGAVGILLSAAFLYFAFHGIAFAEVVNRLRLANLPLMLLAAVVATCIFPLRALRWRPILDPIAPHLPFSRLWSATAIGMVLNNVAPARAGEFARAYALSRSTPEVSFPAAFASLAVDRVFDAVVVLLLMFGAMISPAFPRDATLVGRPVVAYAPPVLLITLAAIAVLYGVALFPDKVLRIYELVARRLAPRLESRGRDALVSLAGGLSVLRTPGRFAAVFAWTVVHWLVNALAFWIAFRAVGVQAPFSAALFLQGLIAIGVAIPQAPGFFGVFETFGKYGLEIYGVAPDAAVTWALGFHFLSYIPITVIGGWYFVRAGLSMRDLGGAERAATQEVELPPPVSTPAT
jgi:uncharacterized protein (TIRG00374 family)